MFENVAFERCFPSSGRHIVEVDQCLSASSEGSVALHNVTFRRNRLEDASAVHVRSPSCRTLEMTDVAFVDNVCSHACFGRLSANNVLRGVEMHRNADAQLEGHSASLLSLPPGSATQATRCDVRNNDVTVIKAEGATLQLSASVFEENRGRTVLLLKQKTETTLTRCRFRRNASGTNSSGGALYAAFAPFTRVSDSVFEENRGKKGGAIFVDHGALDVERCQFVGNEVSGNVRNAGGAIFAIGSRLNLDASIYLDNFADKFGGAVHAEDSAVRMSGAIFEKNAARDGGGAVYLSGVGDFWMENTTFSDGDASDGGALFASKSSGRVVDCAFLGNVAQKGGALRVAFQSSLNVISSHFSHNRANQSHGGGVLAAEESIVRISKTILINNVAKQNGGAVMLDSASEMHAHKVTIKDNHGDLSGGGIHVTKHSRLVLSSSRLRGNSGDFGGALHVTESSRVSAKETFVEKSHAEKNGGGMFIDRESVAVLEHMQFRSNSANLTGAGIRCSTKARVIGSGLIVAKNRARQSGAGIFAQHNCVLRLNVSSVTDNISDTVGGGGIYLREVGDVRLDGVVFRTNRATEGAALYMQMAQAEIKASRFEKDVATKGGSIAAKNATLAIEASDFLNGSAVSAGGCIHLDRGSNAMLNQVVLTSCASRRGGGVFIKSSKLTAEQLIVYACHAHSGGGFFAERDSAVRCSACRFDENRAGSDGGAVSILAAEPRGRAYQFFRCRFHRNSALLGGEYRWWSCETREALNIRGDAFVEPEGQQKLRRSCGELHIRRPCRERVQQQYSIGWRGDLRQLSQGLSVQLLGRRWEASVQQRPIHVLAADHVATSTVRCEEQHCQELWRLRWILRTTCASLYREQPNWIVPTVAQRYLPLSQRPQERRCPSGDSLECDRCLWPGPSLRSMEDLCCGNLVIRTLFHRKHQCAP